MPPLPHRPVLIAGATASGKSALALEIAGRDGGLVINADSMQIYAELSILTARPDGKDEAAAPHRLYGHVSAADGYSVASWLADVAAALAEADALGLRPIIVGGTGLYFKALLGGLSPVPAIPNEVRDLWRRTALHAGPGELHRMLLARDRAMASRLAPGDRQRIARALEVLDATGRSLADWQTEPGVPLVREADAERIVVTLPRDELHRRSARRFDQMIENGALEEVRALLQRHLADDSPALRALGLGPLARHLSGEVTLDQAVERAKIETRQYIKRQQTWLRKYMRDWSVATDIE